MQFKNCNLGLAINTLQKDESLTCKSNKKTKSLVSTKSIRHFILPFTPKNRRGYSGTFNSASIFKNDKIAKSTKYFR